MSWKDRKKVLLKDILTHAFPSFMFISLFSYETNLFQGTAHIFVLHLLPPRPLICGVCRFGLSLIKMSFTFCLSLITDPIFVTGCPHSDHIKHMNVGLFYHVTAAKNKDTAAFKTRRKEYVNMRIERYRVSVTTSP